MPKIINKEADLKKIRKKLNCLNLLYDKKVFLK